MKLRICSFLFFFVSSLFAVGQTLSDTIRTREVFPDSVFRKFVIEQADQNGDNKIQYSEADAITSFPVKNGAYEGMRSVTSLNGIEVFSNMSKLSIRGIAIQTLDLRNCKKLTEIYLGYAYLLSTILWTENKPYTYLKFENNQKMPSIDVSNFKSLKTLSLTAEGTTTGYLKAVDIRGTSLESFGSCDNPRVSICVDSQAQWDAIPNNYTKNQENVSWCQYELVFCGLTTGMENENLPDDNETTYTDYDLIGKTVYERSSGPIIRVYKNGKYRKMIIAQ